MKYSLAQILVFFPACFVYVYLLWFIDQSLRGRKQLWFRYLAAIATIALLGIGVGRVDNHEISVDVVKIAIALTATGCVFYERFRDIQKKPIGERWKKFVGVTLGVAAIVAYFNGFHSPYPKFFHRWDQFHYYMGAKYFKEMGYDGLYKCALIATDELGTISYTEDDGRSYKVDLSKEARHPDRKIRNLGGDNLLKPAMQFLEHPEECKNTFPAARWEQFKEDVKFFRVVSGKGYWDDMLKDHGYNPPPVWTIMGRFFSELHPATVGYCQFLASLDLIYTLGMFAMLWWAFGWRVFAVGAILYGCEHTATSYWTFGAFLRQDWLFFLVASVCLLRKQYPKLAGAALVYAGLLRIFPGLVVVGLLVVVGWTIYRKHKMTGEQIQMLIGGTAAAAVLIPLSIAVSGPRSYVDFYKHTLEVHDHTPLTNHTGLRVLIAHDMRRQAIAQVVDLLESGAEKLQQSGRISEEKAQEFIKAVHNDDAASKASGRMKFTRNNTLKDPFEIWKQMRNDRYKKYRWVGYGIIGLSLALSVWVHRRLKSLWVAQCLGQIWMILLAQLTCYYYSFMILLAPLIKVRRDIEAPIFGFALLTQFIFRSTYYNDDKYTALTLVSLVFLYGIFFALVPKSDLEKLFPKKDEPSVNTKPAEAA
ncbi:MAG TPA: hypothetical protein PKA58_12465 [Polyangium sp.]|nr:hypothetical protein [Polyangium sp.]